jgi:hypothetical protein
MKACTLLLVWFFIINPSHTNGFALLSHEAIINECWEKSILPLLKQEYPLAKPEQIREARAYVYGGALMPDIGYFPFGSSLFSQLVHYVRSGDFVNAVIEEAEDLNEYAFGLGLLCHYYADMYGHPMATNRAVPIMFPKLKKKYGDTVSFEQSPVGHVRTEFGFDVIQTAKGNYDLEAQHDFIDFKVSEPVLKRAFLKTYGMELKNVFRSLPVAVKTFRFAVKQMFPELTKDAWIIRKSIITQINPLADRETYTRTMDRKTYKRDFGRPKIKSSLFSLLMGVLPKVGPFAGLKFKAPNDETEKLFDESIKTILHQYTSALTRIKSDSISSENINYDTGKKTAAGEYKLADKSYYTLLKMMKSKNFEYVNEGLYQHINAFYNHKEIKKGNKDNSHRKKKIVKLLLMLESAC